MKAQLFFTFCLFVAFTATAQRFSITGLAKNEQNEGIPFATVTLFRTHDSTLVKVESCTENGHFKMNGIAPQNYYLVISSVGFQKYRSGNFQLIDSNVDFDSFVLRSDNQLSEVKVKAPKPLVEVLADKTVFNVQGSLSATGTTGLELLRKSPGVVLDNNENIILEGKTGVRIFIDGKPSVLQGNDLNQYLKSLQASDIEAIEIITQPSARFDASGNAGIINIKLKKDKRFGTNGSVSLGYGYGHYGKINGALSFNHRTRKTNLFGTYSNRTSRNWSFLNFYREQVNTVFDQKSETINENQSNNIKLGLDYFASTKSTFGFILTTNFNANDNTTFSRTPIFPQYSTLPTQVLIADNTSQQNSNNVYLNTNYRFADSLGHVLNVDVDLGIYNGDRQSFQPNIYKNGSETQTLFSQTYRMKTPTDIAIFSAKADYEQPFLNGKIGVGTKLSVVKTNNTFNFFNVIDGADVYNTSRSNNFVYTEQINAAYLTYSKNTKKIDVQLGIRAEQTISEGKLSSAQTNADAQVRRNYTNLFPSGGITYKANPNNSLALTYSRRIERPTYQSLNPFEWQLDELTYQKGNAFLQPQYVDNLKLAHTYKYTLTTSLSYSYVRDFFAQITDTTGYNRNFMMERNIANQRVINLGVSYPFQAAKWWNVYASLNAYHTAFESDDAKFKNVQANVLSFYGQNTFSLPQKWNLEVSGWYSSPGIWGGTYVTRSQGSLDLALQKRILNEKVSFRLAVSDLFFTSPWRGTTQFGGLRITGSGGWESRTIRINLSYNFGNKQVKSARQRQTGVEDEKNRIN